MTAGTDSSFGALVHGDWQWFLWQMTASVLCANLPSKNLVLLKRQWWSKDWPLSCGRQVLEAVHGEVECGQAAAWKQIPSGLAHCFNPLLSRSAEGDPEYSGGGQSVSINQLLFLMAGAGRGGQLEVTAGGCPPDVRDPCTGIWSRVCRTSYQRAIMRVRFSFTCCPLAFFMNNALSLSLRKSRRDHIPTSPRNRTLSIRIQVSICVNPCWSKGRPHGLSWSRMGLWSFNPGLTLSLGCVQCLCSHSVSTIELSYHHGCGALSHLPRMVKGQGLPSVGKGLLSATDAGSLVELVTAGVEGSVTAWHALLCALPLDTTSSWSSVGLWEWMGWDCIAIRNLFLCHCRSYAERNLARSPLGHGLSNGGGRWGWRYLK